MNDLIEKLKAHSDDPMWPDHAEVPKAVLRESIAALTAQPRPEPDGYHYRYPYGNDGSVIRKNNGEEVNGCRPIGSVPYWYAAPQPASAPVGVELLKFADRIEKGEPYIRNSTISRWCQDLARDMREAAAHPQPASAPVGVDAAVSDAGHISFDSMTQCANAWLAVVSVLDEVCPDWRAGKGTCLDDAIAAIRALAQQRAAVDASTALRSIYDLLQVNTESDAGAEIARLHIIEAKSQQPAATLPGEDDSDLTVAYMAGLHAGRKGKQQPAAVDEAMNRLREHKDRRRLWMSDLVGDQISAVRMREILTAALAQPQGEGE